VRDCGEVLECVRSAAVRFRSRSIRSFPVSANDLMLRKIAVLLGLGVVAAGALSGCNAHVRGVVVFIGDSNGVRSAQAIIDELSNRDNGYVPVMFVRAGAAIRSPDCRWNEVGCPENWDFWKIRLNEGLQKIQGDAFVVALGVNDTVDPGTPTTRGYSGYDGKIDYLMGLLPSDKMVLWTNLPCALEPVDNQTGCAVVDTALANAPLRWSNLTVLDWANAAAGHPEYMAPNDVHYSAAGQTAWSSMVAAALDARIPDPSATTSTSTTTISTSTSTTTVPDTSTTTVDTTPTTVDTTPTTVDTTPTTDATTTTTAGS
jgi:hypothetical protein